MGTYNWDQPENLPQNNSHAWAEGTRQERGLTSHWPTLEDEHKFLLNLKKSLQLSGLKDELAARYWLEEQMK